MRTCEIEQCEEPHQARGWCKMHYTRWTRHGDPLKTEQPTRGLPFIERMAYHIDASGDCWIWTGAVSDTGYGSTVTEGGRKGSAISAHRAVWETLVGPIPDGMQIDHLCRNRICVNPDHLEVVTPRENTRRGITGEVSGAQQRSKTHCLAGHPYDDENTYYRPNGHRTCRACRRLGMRKVRGR